MCQVDERYNVFSHRLPLSQAPEACRHFVWRGVGNGEDYTKVA